MPKYDIQIKIERDDEPCKEWMLFSERPMSEFEAEDMIYSLQKRYPWLKARKVLIESSKNQQKFFIG